MSKSKLLLNVLNVCQLQHGCKQFEVGVCGVRKYCSPGAAIQRESRLQCVDNTGVKEVLNLTIGDLHIGDSITVSVKKSKTGGKIPPGTLQNAVIVSTRTGVRRFDGSCIRFDLNGCVLIKPNKKYRLKNLGRNTSPVGSRVSCIVPYELRRHGLLKIMSLAKKVI
eukprot:TRINITY_DN38977_c1_g1_i1.p1 TRINITY_DN38977_c1_g1~~TRINITY_DN38977_c1_g1_i1.p1  ORF type:complete len:174 (+),score=5.49 TRINITY_DN38977_c1_g1_i1:27-524(+)